VTVQFGLEQFLRKRTQVNVHERLEARRTSLRSIGVNEFIQDKTALCCMHTARALSDRIRLELMADSQQLAILRQGADVWKRWRKANVARVDLSMPTLEQNLFWDTYAWPRDGDEWAEHPYQVWKRDLVESFIVGNVGEGSIVLEMSPGHGRWTPFLSERAKRYIGVDMNKSCTKFCRKRFSHRSNVEFHTNDGRSVAMIAAGTIHFVWSFDSFVHMECDVTDGYLGEFARILVPGGLCCIHHPGTPNELQRKRGWRSAVSTSLFASMAEGHGLRVLSQVDTWGPNNRSNTKLAGDCISTLEKVSRAVTAEVTEDFWAET